VRRAPYLALQHRDYRRLIVSQLLSLTGSQMQVVAINWHVYLITRSPLALGFVGLTRVVPIVVFSLWGGVVADRFDRRRVMLLTQIAMTFVALGLGLVTQLGRETLWMLYAFNALGASAVAFDGPSRQALIPRLVPPEDLPGALSLNLSVFQAALIGGPALAGVLIGHHPGAAPTAGLSLIYFLNAVSFIAVIFALVTMRTSGAPEPTAGKVEMRDALRRGFGSSSRPRSWSGRWGSTSSRRSSRARRRSSRSSPTRCCASGRKGVRHPRGRAGRRRARGSAVPVGAARCPGARAASSSGRWSRTAPRRWCSGSRATSGSRSPRWRASASRTRSRR
jgi:MFS family permease